MSPLVKNPYNYEPFGDDGAADDGLFLRSGAEKTSFYDLKHHVSFMRNAFALLATALLFGLLGFGLGRAYTHAGDDSLIPSRSFGLFGT